MQQELIIAISAGLGGMLGWGFADFFAKKTIDRVGSIVSLVWAHVFGTIALVLIASYYFFALGERLYFPVDGATWGLLVFFGVLQAAVYLLAYEGFGKGQLALLNPVFASYSGLTALISIVFLGEVVGLPVFVSLLIIFGGILLLNLDIKGLHIKKWNLVKLSGLKEVGLAAILAAFWTLLWDRFIGGQDWITFALLMYLFMTIAAFVFAKVMRVSLSVKDSGVWKFMILIGACEVVAYLAISLGFSATTHTSIVAVLSGAFSLPTVLLARVFLKEKVTRIQAIGTVVIILGIVLVSLL